MNSNSNIVNESIIKKRRAKGDGGLRQLQNGNWEGIEKIKKKSGGFLPKSVTRKNRQEVLLIKSRLKALEPLDDDIIKIEIDKITNEISLIKRSNLISKSKKKVDKDITVDDYVDYWLWHYRRKGLKGRRVKDSTFEDYVQKCGYIKDKLGKLKTADGEIIKTRVADLTFEFMEKQLLQLSKEIKLVSAIQIRNHLYNMMKCAKKDGVIDSNPFQDEEIHFDNVEEKKEKQVIKETCIDDVIKYCLSLWYIDIVVQLLTGARVGEIRGLVWEDIIEDECIIRFSQSYNSVKQFELNEENHIVSLGRKRRYSSLKSKHSHRDIEIPEEYMELLKVHKQAQRELAERLGIEFKETDAVFTTNTYTPLGRNDTNDRVKKVVEDLEIENWNKITSHSLRHGFCYRGLLNDIPLEYMQILLGHSNISVTRKWYAHFDKGKINSYARKVNQNRRSVIKKTGREQLLQYSGIKKGNEMER